MCDWLNFKNISWLFSCSAVFSFESCLLCGNKRVLAWLDSLLRAASDCLREAGNRWAVHLLFLGASSTFNAWAKTLPGKNSSLSCDTRAIPLICPTGSFESVGIPNPTGGGIASFTHPCYHMADNSGARLTLLLSYLQGQPTWIQTTRSTLVCCSGECAHLRWVAGPSFTSAGLGKKGSSSLLRGRNCFAATLSIKGEVQLLKDQWMMGLTLQSFVPITPVLMLTMGITLDPSCNKTQWQHKRPRSKWPQHSIALTYQHGLRDITKS